MLRDMYIVHILLLCSMFWIVKIMLSYNEYSMINEVNKCWLFAVARFFNVIIELNMLSFHNKFEKLFFISVHFFR